MAAIDEIALWDQVQSCFVNNDGSLPTIAVEPLSASEIGVIFEVFIREGQVADEEPVFYDKQIDQMRPLNSVPNAGKLVGEFKASPFHIVFEGITINGHELPALGVFFFQRSIAIDYRMGEEWDSVKILAFFTWLKRLVGLSESGKVAACTSDGPPSPEKFDAAWQAWKDQ